VPHPVYYEQFAAHPQSYLIAIHECSTFTVFIWLQDSFFLKFVAYLCEVVSNL